MNLLLILLTIILLSVAESLLTVGLILGIFHLIFRIRRMTEEKWRTFFKTQAFGKLAIICGAALVLSSAIVCAAGFTVYRITGTDHAPILSVIPVVLALPGLVKMVRHRTEIQQSFH